VTFLSDDNVGLGSSLLIRFLSWLLLPLLILLPRSKLDKRRAPVFLLGAECDDPIATMKKQSTLQVCTTERREAIIAMTPSSSSRVAMRLRKYHHLQHSSVPSHLLEWYYEVLHTSVSYSLSPTSISSFEPANEAKRNQSYTVRIGSTTNRA
jgi:hypothetical protein